MKILNRMYLIAITSLLLMLAWATPALAQYGDQGDWTCTGKSITVTPSDQVGDIVAFGCNVRIEQGATVHGDVVSFGSNVQNAGTIQASILAFGGNIDLTNTAVVNGRIRTFGGNLRRAQGAVVAGSVTRNAGNIGGFIPDVLPGQTISRGPLGFDIAGGILNALALSALGALLVVFAPEQTRRVHAAAQAAPWGSMGVGCLTLLVLPMLTLLLIVTVIGIPVVLILWMAAVAAWFFGWIAIGWLAGERILEALRARQVLPIVAVVVGVILLALVTRVPFIGWAVWVAVTLLGLGAVVLTRFGTRAYPHPAITALSPMGAAGNPPPSPSSTDIARTEPRTDIDRPPSER